MAHNLYRASGIPLSVREKLDGVLSEQKVKDLADGKNQELLMALFGQTTVIGGFLKTEYIAAGSITADKIAAGAITATNIQATSGGIGSFIIDSHGLSDGSRSAYIEIGAGGQIIQLNKGGSMLFVANGGANAITAEASGSGYALSLLGTNGAAALETDGPVVFNVGYRTSVSINLYDGTSGITIDGLYEVFGGSTTNYTRVCKHTKEDGVTYLVLGS